MIHLRISCFGILLKHHLLRHHADELAPRGRLRPVVEEALSGLSAEFGVPLPGVSLLPEETALCGEERRLTLHLDLRRDALSTAAVAAASVCVQGILARRGVVENPCLMPCSVRLLPSESPLTTAGVLQVLACLAAGRWHASISMESRVGAFVPHAPPAAHKKARRPGRHAPQPVLARVA